jgi:hypothetical protein
MRRIGEHLTYANVMATFAVFLVLSGGTAVALSGSNTVFSDDIVNGEVKGPDVGVNAVTSPKVADRSLSGNDLSLSTLGGGHIQNGTMSDVDIGSASYVHFTASIPDLPAHQCRGDSITGLNAKNDHMLLTPASEGANFQATYQMLYRTDSENAILATCNPHDTTLQLGTKHFNLLVIRAANRP